MSVPGNVLVHLIEAADWRRALDDGAVRPPSLTDVGFVHLSTPEQVHLPAARIYPGRRDLLLLVVDPARLSDPVRWEPGVPTDPASMLFPHLYGPLPTSAVTAVVPYRPPVAPQLPGPDDAAGRARALLTGLPVRRSPLVVDVPGGVSVTDRRYPSSQEDNQLLLQTPVDAATLVDAVRQARADGGWPTGAATLAWPDAEPVAHELLRHGWDVAQTVIMALPDPRPALRAGRAEVVPQSVVRPFWAGSWRHELAGQPAVADVVAQLVDREQHHDEVLAAREIVVRERGAVLASGQLRIDGATAELTAVLTDPTARRAGRASAVLDEALGLAAAAGCDLVVLEAAAGDWPRAWYARRGFQEVGRRWSVRHPGTLRPGR